ncbi:MAG TPA: hypothetical protein VF985_04910 [Mariniflexile sp.]
MNNLSEYQLIELAYKNNELKIESRFFSNDFDKPFKEKLTKDYPIILHIEGDNIINKQVENKVGYRNDLIFKANPDEFYFFEYHQNETVFISVTRKQNVDDFIKQISDTQRYVVYLSFGPFVMANLIPVVKDYDTISSSNYTIKIRNGELLSFENEQISFKEFIINGDRLTQRELPLLAAFLNYKYPNPAVEFNTEFLSKNKDEFKFKKWFKIAGIFTLAFFLISLSISHYLMGFYLNRLAEKESLNAMSQQTIIQVEALKEEKALKEKILLSSGIGNKSFLTKYVTDIGNSVPQNIILNTIYIMPPFKKIKTSEKINFDINGITIRGESENDKSFNDWLIKLEALTWIRKMDIEGYSQETKTENTFTIKIKI